MNRLRNIYLWVLLIPLVSFVAAILAGLDADNINIAGRLYVFGLMAYSAVRYVGRAPVLMWRGDVSPEARNISGFAIFMVAIMAQMAYGVMLIGLDRPSWLVATYWSAGLVILAGVGMTLVASSVPRFPFPPFGKGNGYSVATSFLVGFLSAGALFMAQHIPVLWKAVQGLFLSLQHVF